MPHHTNQIMIFQALLDAMNIGVSLEGVDVSLSDIKISYATAAIDDLDIPAGMQIGATVGFLDMEAESSFQLSSDSADVEVEFSGDTFEEVMNINIYVFS